MSLARRNDINTTAAGGTATWLRLRGFSLTWSQVALFGIMGLSAFLNLYRLDPTYYTNEYYAAAVRSQLPSWHNFFFNAYDPGGFITIDKPPVAFWFETASAWLFGFNGVSILLPSALAGVISVGLVYAMVKRSFGTTAGLFAGLALAVTPISVVMNRHNNPESLLILALVVAAWALSKALQKGSLSWLLLAVAMVGVGFNIKMLEAFIVLPGFYLVYLLLAPVKWWKRFVHLTLATVVLAAVSLSWALVVQLTPADSRPFIGGSGDNNIFSLIIDYNGLGRIDGNEFGGNPGGGQPPAQFGGGKPPAQFGAGQPPAGFPFPGNSNQAQVGGQQARNGGITDGNANRNRQNAGGFPTGGRGGGGGNPIMAGQSGPFRMFDPNLAGEAGWLLPLALLGLAIAGAQTWWRFPAGKERRQRQQMLMLWGGWLLTFMVVFSMAKGIFHSYYLVMLAPALAALVGAGLEALWYEYRRGGWRSWFLPVVLVISAIFELNILGSYSNWNRTLALVMVGVELLCAAALLALPRLLRAESNRWAVGVTAVALLGLLAAPFAWAINAILNKTYSNATLPSAVPTGSNSNFGGFGGFGNRNTSNHLLTTLQANWNGWLSGLVITLVVLVALALMVRFFLRQLKGQQRLSQALTLATVAVVISLGMSLAVNALPPASASANTNSAPASVGIIGNPSMTLSSNDKLIAYLEANRNGSTYLLATASSQNASPIIIKTGEPVMALGGFMGSDRAATAQDIAQMVKDNTVRYFLLDGGGFGGGRGGGTQSATSWVQQTCKVVDSSLWSASSTTSANGSTPSFPGNFGGPGRGFGAVGQLYDCSGAA